MIYMLRRRFHQRNFVGKLSSLCACGVKMCNDSQKRKMARLLAFYPPIREVPHPESCSE